MKKLERQITEVKSVDGNTTYRVLPYTMKSQKLLFLGIEEDSVLPEEDTQKGINLFNAIVQVVNNSLVDNTKINVLELPYVDFIKIILELRKISKSDAVDVSTRCGNKDCRFFDGEAKFLIDDILQIKLSKNENDVVKLTDTLGIKLKQPTVQYIKNTMFSDNPNKTVDHHNYDLVLNNLHSELDGEEINIIKNVTEAEDILGRLIDPEYQKLVDWFVNDSKIFFKLEWECEKCKHKNSEIVDEILDFLEL